VPAHAVPKARRRLVASALWLGALTALAPPPAAAHPLGNTSVNHLTYVKVFPDRVSMLYVLDQAEFPTLRDVRRWSPRELFLAKLQEVRGRLAVTVDGRRMQLEINPDPQMRFRRGVGNLPTVRIALPVIVRVARPTRVVVEDRTFPGRLGVVLVVPLAGEGTSVRRLDGPVDDPSRGLRLVPPDGKYEDRRARLSVAPGAGTVTGSSQPRPVGPGGKRRFKSAGDRKGDAFSRLFERAASGEGVFVLFLLAAFAWGALHALSPGHGKGMVAAYLVGTRGTARDAVALGGIVTVTHTAGVFALGLVTLLLTQYVLPEDVYPWLNLVAGLLIVGVGLGVLRSRIRWGRQQRGLHPDTRLEGHGDEHGHHHHEPAGRSGSGLVAMGLSAGLIPCPSALVVLLGALTQHQVGLGLILIVAFSIGLAMTLTVLGLLVVYARQASGRLPGAGRLASTRVGAFLPALSTVLILGLGVLLTARALPGVL
jgi:ABC-type nickel/cobalt efflux system permease component RcnA